MRRQPLALRRTSHLPIHQMAPSSGFSLVELIIVAGLTAVVLAGLGAITLISDVRLGRRSNSNSMQEAQEQWGRAVTFIQNEAADADSLSGTLSPGAACDGVKTNPALVLNVLSGPDIIYGVRERTADEVGLYRGPKLLIRCGPYQGEPEPLNRVLLDGLTEVNPLQVQLLAHPVFGQPAQDAIVTITLDTGTNTAFRVHAQRTPSL